MNLWNLLPDCLLDFNGIFYLPLLILPSYLACIVTFIRLDKVLISRRKKEVLPFLCFLLLSLIAEIVMWTSIGPQIGKVIPPLILLSNLVLPLLLLISSLKTSSDRSVMLWGWASLAGGIHALSWSVWLMALASS